MPRIPLPIDEMIPELLEAQRRHANAVVRAPTGSGKTTRVPPALLDAGLAGPGRILMLEPRRLAARAAARRIAEERGGRVGDEVGYQVRFDRCWGRHSRLVVLTPGILLRMLHDDACLESASTVILDEFHERGWESDLALGFLRHLQQQVRPELRLVAMSATMDVEAATRFLGDCPVVSGGGRLHPVEIVYEPKPEGASWHTATAAAIEGLLQRSSGDVLAFLPGWREIRQTQRELERIARRDHVLVVPLHGDLPADEQDRALLPQPQRRIVLATNVAETSVTVTGITGVVDTGLARILRYDPSVGLDRLELEPIARASADQRAGRAGRTQPGICVRLWSELQHRARGEQTEPEIRRVDVSAAVLHLLALGETALDAFPWFDAPRPQAVQQALLLLRRLGAWSGDALTIVGRTLARLPIGPRLGRLLLEGQRLGNARRAALAAALLTERDPFRRLPDDRRRPHATTDSDLFDRVEILEACERGDRIEGLDPESARSLLRTAAQLHRSVAQESPAHDQDSPDPDVLSRALLAAFPDRLARRREAGSRRGVMVGGRGVRLAPTSGVADAPFFVCVDVDAGQTEALVRMASAVRRDWIPHEQRVVAVEVHFNPISESVEARQRTRFEDLTLEELPAHLPAGDEVARVLCEAAAARLPKVLPREDSAAGQFLARVRWLRDYMPELALPAFEESELRDLLFWLCAGCKSFAELREADWLGQLQGRLTHAQRQALEREAPERLEVPSGSKLALRYEAGRPPVLAVRIQELFGLAETPRLACGRVRVVLHLLAPNFRPQQVTDDLASFWMNTYPQVRKELRGRYPKHAWPEDPIAATPHRGGKRRA